MLNAIASCLWGPGTLALVLGTGAFLTVRTRFLPWRKLGRALSLALGRESRRAGRAGISPFSSLMTALAATIGTGNLVGVATALSSGGPGALVWMELAAALGLSTKFAECLLCAKYRRVDRRGQLTGGPMYVMAAALGPPGAALAAMYAALTVLASGSLGALTQSNAIAGAWAGAAAPAVVGVCTAALTAPLLLGGGRRVAGVCTWLVPAMGLFYLAAGAGVILGNLPRLPEALGTMLRCAFSFRSVSGGAAGAAASGAWQAMRWGVARGVFSNEAGLGSAGIAAAGAGGDPVRQGCIGMTGVFFDTCVVCTVTGLAICCSGALGAVDDAGCPVSGAALTLLAFESVWGAWGGRLLRLAAVLFAASSVLGWDYQGEAALVYLTGGRGLGVYRAVFSLLTLLGAVVPLEAVFSLTDICCALMAMPNLLCLLLLSGEIARDARRSAAQGRSI